MPAEPSLPCRAPTGAGFDLGTMRHDTHAIFLHCGGAVVSPARAVVLRWLLDPGLADYLPFPTLYGAVALAVWFGGYRPAVLAAVLGVLACDWLFVEPRGAFSLD